MNRLLVLMAVLVALPSLLFGCSPTIMAKPPAFPADVPPQVLAVGQFRGPEEPFIRQALEEALAGRQGIQLVEPDKADRIVTGEVAFQLVDTRGQDLVKIEEPTGHTQQRIIKDTFVNREYVVDQPLLDTHFQPIPYVYRSARLSLTWDLRTPHKFRGRPETITADLERKYGGLNRALPDGPTIEDLPSREDAIRELARRVAEIAAERIAPAPTLPLYHLDMGEGIFGDPDLKESVFAAQNGDWETARQSWQVLLDRDSEHAAALYNMGVYFEAHPGTENLKTAFEYYTRAAKAGSNPLYREALTRVAILLKKRGLSPKE